MLKKIIIVLTLLIGFSNLNAQGVKNISLSTEAMYNINSSDNFTDYALSLGAYYQEDNLITMVKFSTIRAFNADNFNFSSNQMVYIGYGLSDNFRIFVGTGLSLWDQSVQSSYILGTSFEYIFKDALLLGVNYSYTHREENQNVLSFSFGIFF